MKKLLLMVSAVIVVLTSCEKEDSGPKNFNHEEGFKYLSGLNVSDAKMIYQKESSITRAGGADGGYWKIDLSGKESKLIIKGEDGQNHDINIDKVVKLNDRIIMIQPNACEICYLIGAYGLGGDNRDEPYIMVGEEHYTSFVDVKTEKIYKCPSEFNAFGYNKSDSKNNVYFRSPRNSKLYKLDVSNFTIQQILPNGQEFEDFSVTDDGFVTYSKGEIFKTKCPEGRIVPIQGNGFVWNDKIYSIDNDKIYLWSPVGMNNMEKKEICSNNLGLSSSSFLINNVRNTIVFLNYITSGNIAEVAEFDGVKISEPFIISDKYFSNNIILSSKAWYKNDNSKMYKLDMSNYQEKEIPILDYEIQKLYGDTNKTDLMFEGMRYSDGASVFGTIKDTDEIIIDNVSESGNKIINLIPLN